MINQLSLLNLEPNKSDIVYTSDWLALDMINWVKPQGKILDPCKGDGAFIQYLPDADWCEIREGKDFFNYAQQVDWIIGNPPYSIFDNFLEYSFELATNVVYILPTNKVFQRQKIMKMINKWGGLKG